MTYLNETLFEERGRKKTPRKGMMKRKNQGKKDEEQTNEKKVIRKE
jgi:hypothetical protein